MDDEFEITLEREFRNGRAYIAQSKVESVVLSIRPQNIVRKLRSGDTKPRLLLYTEGTPYEIGFLTGELFHSEIELACDRWIGWLSANFFVPDIDRKMLQAPEGLKFAYEMLVTVLSDIVIDDCHEVFFRVKRPGSEEYLQELKGIQAGIESVKLTTNVTRNKLIALSFGIDYLMDAIMSGRLLQKVQSVLEQTEYKDDFKKTMFYVGDMCNTSVLWGNATSNGDSWFLRDFQLANGRLFDKLHIIHVRKQNSKHITAGISVPGCVGYITAMNDQGLACAVNLVRSNKLNVDKGIGVLMTLRAMVEEGSTTIDARKVLKRLGMGVPWIITVGDPNDGVVFETTSSGIVSRSDKKIQTTGPYYSSKPWTNWKQEERARAKYGNSRFVKPEPSQKGVVVATNFFLDPRQRKTQNCKICTKAESTGTGAQWRYQQISKMIRKYYGRINEQKAKEILTFLDPKKRPNHPQNIFLPKSKYVVIEGFLFLANLSNKTFQLKSGFWHTDWIKVDMNWFA